MADVETVNYELTVHDYLVYQEKMFFYNRNVKGSKAIKRWLRLAFLLLIIIYPVLVFIVTKSVIMTLVMFVLSVFFYYVLNKQAKNIFWKRYQPKIKKELVEDFFKEDDTSVIEMTASFSNEQVILTSETNTKTILAKDIVFNEMKDNYFIFYTDTNEGGIIPLEQIEESSKILDWFQSAQQQGNQSK